MKDNLVVAVGTNEQAEALLTAIDDAERSGSLGTRQHLLAAGQKLANGDWTGSIRDSIHAVEATAVILVPETATLGPALSRLEQDGKLNGGLKKAFGALYGYTCDHNTGVRHARCLIPSFDGAIFSAEWKEALWDKFFMAAPARQRRSVEQYKIVKRA